MMGDVQNLDVIRDWEHLSRTNETSERDDVTSDELDSVGRTFVQNVRDLVEQELYVVATDARKAADIFWEINQEVRESGVAGEQGYFGTRVRVLNKSIAATWHKNRFVPGPGDKKKVFSTHLEKGLGPRYPTKTFKGARDWELEAIQVTEDRYSLLRQRSNALSKIRRALSEYERLLDKCYQE
ncbi:conjugative transfer protein MobI(A/C) [Alcaligenes faecalis]|nr:conjugative transfer protein MobI(A/C) [Alcaligenes faecalis]QHS38460.1 hypothetical protein GWQ43_20065 [Alcaligenes faecalis]RSE57596.1 hypothetical protein EGT81_19355 [Alcaligenes faecalis]WHQ45905.1 hypothetical protein E8D21_19840 [Alcaligenes faecalis]